MKTIAILIISLILIGIEFLCGCNDYVPEKREYKIGESVIFENIKYTFLSAYWNDSVYTLKIKGENIGSNKQESSNVIITQYEMQNGNTYRPIKAYGITAVTFYLSLWENDIKILTDFSSIDRNFLPVTKIYLQLYSPGGYVYPSNTKPIEINVTQS
jgi:hypothetical protein